MKKYLIGLKSKEYDEIEIYAKNKKEAKRKAEKILERDFAYEFRVDTIEEIKRK